MDQGVKITGLESFDGTTDPNDHLSYYENLIIYHRYNDISKCRLFISTFKAYARTWFSGLPPTSVNSWEEFKAASLAKFRVNTPQAVHTISLENVKQNHGESLRDYIEMFKTNASKVRELRPANAVDSFIRNMNYQECKDCWQELCNKELLICKKLITLPLHTLLRMKELEHTTMAPEMKLLVLEIRRCK